MITRKELIKKYIDFFESKGHKKIPNASLVRENDPTVLFTTAGMHPLVPYMLGQKHPLGKRLTGVQRCIRTTDIDKVGDSFHHTFFEMLGNWSLGDYWKKDAIEFSFNFLTKVLKIPKDRIAITCFKGQGKIPMDKESERAWIALGIPKRRISFLGKQDNWWGPAGLTGPCGPDTEMFYWESREEKTPVKFNPQDEKWREIWNDVFMEYSKTKNNEYPLLKQKNVDTGMGVERTVTILNGLEDNYLADMWKPIIEKIENLSKREYSKSQNKRPMRIVADHIKASVFIISDGVSPGNTGRGYVLRRLIRRAVRYGKELQLENFTSNVAEPVFDTYKDYPELKNKKHIIDILKTEEEKFVQTLENGEKVLMKMIERIKVQKLKRLSGKDAFLLYQSYGFPLELIKETAEKYDIDVDKNSFDNELEKHQKLSKKLSAGTFKSGLADNSEKVTRLHTATHLLNEALREVLDKNIKQRGSNITPERLRFDFNFPRKLTKEELKKVENLINKKIKDALPVKREEMSLNKAIESGAQSEFGEKYPDIVSVYTIEDPSKKRGWFSKEICTGPHVANTREVGKFRILKEESSASGVRRIKATVG